MKTHQSHHHWFYWLKLIAGIALIAVIYYKINNHESVIGALQKARWQYVFVCLLLLIPNVYLAYLKWRFLLCNRFSGIRNGEVFGSLLFGYTLGLITPGRLGELGRGFFFPNQDRLAITGLNVLDKIANQVIIFTLGGIALLVLIHHYGAWNFKDARYLLSAGGAALLAVWAIILNPALLKRLLLRLQRRLPPNSRRRSMLKAFDELNLADSLKILGLTLAWYLVIIFQYHILVNAFTAVSLVESFWVVSAVLFTKTLLPFTFGDLGIREGVAVFYYSVFQVSEAAVFNAAILIFAINFLIPALCGIYYLFRVRELRNAAPQPAASHHSPSLAGEE